MKTAETTDNNGAMSTDGDARRVQSVKGTKGDQAREARIKAALKANIARRKAQARAREESEESDD